MRFWHHAATFLAFVLVAAIIVFAGYDHHTNFASGGDAQSARRAAADLRRHADALTASAPIKKADVSQ